MSKPTDNQTSEGLDRRVHISHCYQGENLTNCKYGENDCPAKPRTTESDEQLIKLIGSRCETPDYIDFPDLKPGERCGSCEMWDAVDAYVAGAQKVLLDRLEAQAIDKGAEHKWLYIPLLAIEAERQQLGNKSAK